MESAKTSFKNKGKRSLTQTKIPVGKLSSAESELSEILKGDLQAAELVSLFSVAIREYPRLDDLQRIHIYWVVVLESETCRVWCW